MKYSKILFVTSVLIVLLGIHFLVTAEETTCPELVQKALSVVGNSCVGLGRNQVCYGNAVVKATSSTQTALTGFEAPGDMARIGDIIDLATEPLDPKDNVWGVAMLALQANLPDTVPGQNVLFVVFGDTELRSDTAETANPVKLNATAKGNANIRTGPDKNYAVAGNLTAGQSISLIGRNAAGDWLRLDYGDVEGWVFSSLVTVEGDIQTLAVMGQGQAAGGYTAPMQAFRLKTTTG